MEPDTLGKLAKAHDTAWKACHGMLISKIATEKARLHELEAVRRNYQIEADEAQEKFNEWAEKARRVDPIIKGRAMRRKFEARFAQCRLYGQDARAARVKRDEVSEAMAQIRAQINSKEAELAYRMRHYCDVRHQYMEAIYEAEKSSPEAQAQKIKYLDAGQLLGIVEPEEVRYYVHDRLNGTLSEVHLFYGGADAPDGDGHGHTVLHVTPKQIMLRYQRAPK